MSEEPPKKDAFNNSSEGRNPEQKQGHDIASKDELKLLEKLISKPKFEPHLTPKDMDSDGIRRDVDQKLVERANKIRERLAASRIAKRDFNKARDRRKFKP